MGSDDLFHKRKAKVAGNLKRRRAKRSPYDKVLIVCEGEKTEPNYFNELIQFYKLNTANVEIDGSSGSSPKSVYDRAISLRKIEENKGDPFDRIYCVFDKDSHETYDETLSKINSVKPRNPFHASVSVPCFEYWILLHFKYTTKPYAATGKSSIANEVIRELKQFIPHYTKGSNNIFSITSSNIKFAKENAIRALQEAQKNGADNPSTYIHNLVDYLQNLETAR